MRRTVVVLLIVAGWSATAGAAPLYDIAIDAHVRKTVLVIGDSNIERGANQLVQALTDRPNAYISIITARTGMGVRGYISTTNSADWWQIRLPQLLASVQPDVVVIELGANDTSQPGTVTTPGYASYGQKINWLRALLPEVPILWTNLPCSIEPLARRAGCSAVNWALALSPTVTMVNWGAAAMGHFEYMIPGQVHLTAAGYTAYSRVVAQALDAIP